MLKKLFASPSHGCYGDVALLITRLVAGYAFILHGYGKIQAPMGWMGPESPVPGALQALAALAEFGGGIALILGLVTRLGALGIWFTMLVAMCMHKFVMGDSFVSMGQGSSYEPAAIYFLIATMILAFGPGKYSVDKKIFGPK